jgi:hypothetical protein
MASLLGRKPDGTSESAFYSFYGGYDKSEERPGHKSFRECLEQGCGASPIQLRAHPTHDYEKVPDDVLNAAAKSIAELLCQGHTVVLVDSGGEQRTRQVCCYMGAVEDSSVISGQGPQGSPRSWPNTYEATSCQETNHPLGAVFCFFSAF